MKISLNWLKQWVALTDSPENIAHKLTMAGIEATAQPAVQNVPTGVVVGHIVECVKHPEADKLQVCKVSVGGNGSSTRTIVCGASNARVGLKVAAALPEAVLPGDVKIGEATLRGVASSGMLCSAKELAIAEQSDGILELDSNAPLGIDVADYLALKDNVIEIELTPNRGDCLSVLGLARELAAIYELPLTHAAPQAQLQSSASASIDVQIEDTGLAPGYCGQAIRGVNAAAKSPDWMQQALLRSGLRSVSAIVDVTNYVMLELGQPMHAFDADKLASPIVVRSAKAGEALTLLNGQKIGCSDKDLLITDANGPLALAGVMGGGDSEVSGQTENVFLESANFAPAAVAGTGRRYKIHTDAAYRYERGVDVTLQKRALARAAELIVRICGGEPEKMVQAGSYQAPEIVVPLNAVNQERLLGYPISQEFSDAALERLGLTRGEEGWKIPPFRYDLRIEQDLIEEVARLYGYDHIPATPYSAHLVPAALPESRTSPNAIRDFFAARDWQEIVTYSFVDKEELLACGVAEGAIELDNPIAEHMNTMRTSLIPGLLNTLKYNLKRQELRVKLFELGRRYILQGSDKKEIIETELLSGCAGGSVFSEQWSSTKTALDFYDVKADLEAIFGRNLRFQVPKKIHPAFHPGQSAELVMDGEVVGVAGALHPALLKIFDLGKAPVVFELELNKVTTVKLPSSPQVSEFPSSRRDLALIVPEGVISEDLTRVVLASGGQHLRDCVVFDVFENTDADNPFKSIALGLIFQENSRTLTDTELEESVSDIIYSLREELGVKVRGQ